MSWLEELNADRKFNYRFEDGTVVRGTLKELSALVGNTVLGEPEETISVDGETAVYAGFDAIPVRQRAIIEFEKNGRKAIAIKEADGTTRYVSKTKMNYQKTGRIENKYTDDYQEILDKQIQNELMANKYKAKQHDPMKEAIKNLADGEYVSDGKNFYRADGYEEQVKSAKPTKKENTK